MLTLWSSPETGFSTNGLSSDLPSTTIVSSPRISSVDISLGRSILIPRFCSTTSEMDLSSFGPPSRLHSRRLDVGTPILSRTASTSRRSQNTFCKGRSFTHTGLRSLTYCSIFVSLRTPRVSRWRCSRRLCTGSEVSAGVHEIDLLWGGRTSFVEREARREERDQDIAHWPVVNLCDERGGGVSLSVSPDLARCTHLRPR